MSRGTFVPHQLFSSGAQGAWYDPSNFSTLYQDSAGTTPVTAVEQPVGLMLDRSGRGNDATAPNDASRPVLRSRYNLLTFSEQFDNGVWAKDRATITANAGVAPDGTMTADKLVEDSTATNTHRTRQTRTTIAASYTATIYAKAAERSIMYIRLDRTVTEPAVWFDLAAGTVGTQNAGMTGSITALPDGWYRCQATLDIAAAASNSVLFGLAIADGSVSYTGDGTSGILIWGAQFQTAADQTATGGAYQRIAAATDYDVSNPVWRPYLAFDGSDDSFFTSSIDFSATDEVTVFAGVTKLSDAARGVIAELTASATDNNGAFLLAAPNAASATFAFESKGTALTDAVETSIAAPTTAVLTGIGDISGDVTTLRRNGTQRDSDTGDQGTGNYANAPLYIGNRGGSSLRLNGRLYGLTVLGRTATPEEINAMEAWVAGKTGITI